MQIFLAIFLLVTSFQVEKVQRDKLESYFNQGGEYLELNKDLLAHAYYDSALFVSDQLEENEIKCQAWYKKGFIYHYKGKRLDAIQCFEESITSAEFIENFKQMGTSYSMLGTTYRVIGFYERAIKYTLLSKLNYEKAGFDEGVAWVNYLLGRIYYDLNLSDKAREYFIQSQEDYEKLAAIDKNYGGVALCLEQIGLINLESGHYEDAMSSFESVLKIHENPNPESGLESKSGISGAYMHLGMVLYSNGQYADALEYLTRALEIKNSIGNILPLPTIYKYIGLCEYESGNTTKGIQFLENAFSLAQSNKQITVLKSVCSSLFNVYLKENNLPKALFYSQKQIEIQEQILSETAVAKQDMIQEIISIETKNNQIQELEKVNTLNTNRIQKNQKFIFVLTMGLAFVFFVAIVILRLLNKNRRKNNQLHETNATKDKLFSIISHDLKGPLGAVAGLSEVLSEEAHSMDRAVVAKYSLLMNKSLKETNLLLNNLLDWAGTQLNHLEFKPMNLNLRTLTDEVIEPISVQAQSKSLDIQIAIPDDFHVWADQNMLETILRNLISNAIKFSNLKGTIIIQASNKNTETEILIRDYGIGMSKEMVDLVFQSEVTQSRSGTNNEKGTGIGLLIVKEFVAIHQGTITIKSKESEGSEFIVSIPSS